MKKRFNKSINYFISFTVFFQSSTSAWSTLLRPEETPQLTASAIREMPSETNRKIIALQNSIETILDRMNTLSVNKRIVVIGPTGSGKTTLFNALSGVELNIHQGSAGSYLDTKNPLPNFEIARVNNLGTKIPTCGVYEEDNLETNKIAWWDCPGFMDPRGSEADIVNAFAIDRLFQNAMIKIILVVEESSLTVNRGGNFFELLDKISNSFVNQEQLKECLTLIITKQHYSHPHSLLSEYAENEGSKKNNGENNVVLSNNRYGILDFLSKNKDRVACFPYPRENSEVYEFDKEAIIESIEKSHFIANPSI